MHKCRLCSGIRSLFVSVALLSEQFCKQSDTRRHKDLSRCPFEFFFCFVFWGVASLYFLILLFFSEMLFLEPEYNAMFNSQPVGCLVSWRYDSFANLSRQSPQFWADYESSYCEWRPHRKRIIVEVAVSVRRKTHAPYRIQATLATPTKPVSVISCRIWGAVRWVMRRCE